MSDQIKHECGIALIRLLKPQEYYLSKYGTSFYAINKMHLLMEKQHNRGQDGAGIVNIKFDLEPGHKYINRLRSNSDSPIKDIFDKVFSNLSIVQEKNPKLLNDINWLKYNFDFTGELLLGHLRYGTFGKNSINDVHPFIRSNNWKTKSLVLAGNFNLTNVDELFQKLVEIGQYPVETSDTITILEKIGHFLDEENELLYNKFKKAGYTKKEITPLIAKNLDIQKILTQATEYWDGGYVISGLLGHGDAFVMRDEHGIRPAYYYHDDEVIVVASERPAIQTTFNVKSNTIHEIKPGNALIIKRNGEWKECEFKKPGVNKACSFERIYFSRGTDSEIYKERKKLGKLLVPSILKAIDYDIKNSVFSYIPNTAIDAFYGMVEGLNNFCNEYKKEKIIQLGNNFNIEKINEIFDLQPRTEKLTVKDVKLRTFITQDNKRDDLVAHVYDITYGTIKNNLDNLIIIDDSIVRGTTLKQSIIKILDRLNPKKILIISSAPQIRYPDCYGIDMAKLQDFIAFNAAIELLKETNQSDIINTVYKKSKAQENLPKEEIVNYVKEIYAPFTAEQISKKVAELITNEDINADIEVIFQNIENLHEACPKNRGDWYFTGDYPTPGGNKVVNKSFINYIEKVDKRAY